MTQPDDAMDRARTIGLFDLEAVDKHAVISDWMTASKLIWGASLPSKERAQVLFNRGILAPDRLVTMLRTMFLKLHEKENRTGQAVQSTVRRGRQRFP